MAYSKDGLALLGDRATIGTGKGSTKRTWSYFTNDAFAVVETNGYFDAAAEVAITHGDIILVAGDIDGTEGLRAYVATVTPGDVALTALSNFNQATAEADLNQTIGGSYSQAEVQAISDKVDAVLAKLRTAGVIAT